MAHDKLIHNCGVNTLTNCHDDFFISTGQSNGEDQAADFLAFELLEGHVFALINMGSGAVKVKATTRRIDDGHWHSVSFRRQGKTGRVTVDETSVDFVAPGQSSQLDLEGPLYLGGLGALPPTLKLPPELWAASLGVGFVGCVRDLVLNNEPVDIGDLARKQDTGGVRPACHVTSGHCKVDLCENGGVCHEGWNRHACDCSRTGFAGPNCGKGELLGGNFSSFVIVASLHVSEATTLSFNGHQFMRVGLGGERSTQAEDVHIRFRTTRPSGLLVATKSSEKSMNHLLIALDQGKLKIVLNMGEGNKVNNAVITRQRVLISKHSLQVVHIGRDLNDDLYHSLKIERRGPSLEIKLDGVTQMASITGMLIQLQMNEIHLGN